MKNSHDANRLFDDYLNERVMCSCFSEEPRYDISAPVIYDVDVIVPVYNTDKYLRKCLDSLKYQDTNFKYRIIAVNDDSNESTLRILEEYADDPLFLIVNKKHNEGLSCARNDGISISQSRYLLFIDSDDFCSTDMIESLLNMAYQHDADVVQGGYDYLNSENQIYKTIKYPNGVVEASVLNGFAWGKLYRRDIFKNMIFPPSYWFEDTVVNLIVFNNPQYKLCSIENIIYHYRYNETGITASASKNIKSIDSVYLTISLLDDMNRFGIDTTPLVYESIVNQLYVNFLRTKFLSLNNQKKLFDMTVGKICSLFPQTVIDNNSTSIGRSISRKSFQLYYISCVIRLLRNRL